MIRSVVKKELLPLIKNNQEFITSIQLSRILSAVRYINVIYAKLIEKDDVSSNIYITLFYYHAALIYEGVKTFEKLKPKLKNLDTYRRYNVEIEKILKDKRDKNSVLNKIFRRVRNKITFHFDECVIKEIFGIYVDDIIKKQKDIIFLEGKTQTIKDMNYVLADDMNINYILRFMDDKILSDIDKFKNITKELVDLSKLFIEIIELMMVELIKDICEVKKEN